MNLPPILLRLVPHERYRALLVGLVCGLLGYLSPPLIAAFTDRWQFPLERASIEQLRHDSALAPCSQIQQLLVKVMESNMEIARKHRERTLWYTHLFVSPHWLEIPTLEVPCSSSR